MTTKWTGERALNLVRCDDGATGQQQQVVDSAARAGPAGRDQDPFAGQGEPAILLPLRDRAGVESIGRTDRIGESEGRCVRLVRRRRPVAPARPAFGKRIEGVFAEESSVSYRIRI